ncbi:MAG: tyrosine-protein phosphatase [Kiritimatiellia bacterium]
MKPPRPELTKEEIEARDKQNAAYEAWVQAGRDKATKVKPWQDRFNFYMNNDWTAELMKRAEQEEREYKPFQWTSDDALTSVVVEFSETPDFAKSDRREDRLQQAGFGDAPRLPQARQNIPLARERDGCGRREVGFGRPVVHDHRHAAAHDRRAVLEHARPRRRRERGGRPRPPGDALPRTGELGPGEPGDARRALCRTSSAFVRELDLRNEEEFLTRCRQWGETDLATLGIRHVFFPIIPYHMYYQPNLPELRKIFTFLADAENYPVYINCAVGSDRTGTLAFLISGVIGRDERYFYDDYELPSFNVNLPRYRYSRKAVELFEDVRP